MSAGEQQIPAMGRSLMSNPRLILMDEPSLGLLPILCKEIAGIIKQIHAQGRTIVLVEQNARLALSSADYGYVLKAGYIALEDDAGLRADDGVGTTYLGI